jgi:hypothetical protein
MSERRERCEAESEGQSGRLTKEVRRFDAVAEERKEQEKGVIPLWHTHLAAAWNRLRCLRPG